MATLRAGRAKVDVTPPVGTTMDGFAGRTGPSEGIHDRLFCRAIVLQNESKSVALASCDLAWLPALTVQEARRLTKAAGIDLRILAATHNHSGPAMADFLVGPTSLGTEYVRSLPGLISDTILKARQEMQEVRVGTANGRAKGSTNRRKASGETDSEVLAAVLMNDASQPLAGILNYACHPTVLGEQNRQISADYPGRCAEQIERRFGEGFVCLFLNGACGDINPRTCVGYDCKGTFKDVESMARKVSDAVPSTPEFAVLQGDGGIRVASSVAGPFAPYGLRFGMEALRLGGLVILGIPGEVFASTGLWLKGRLPSDRLMISCYTNGYVGYLPTKDAFVRGDYETKWVCWVDESAEEVIRARAAALVEDVMREGASP